MQELAKKGGTALKELKEVSKELPLDGFLNFNALWRIGRVAEELKVTPRRIRQLWKAGELPEPTRDHHGWLMWRVHDVLVLKSRREGVRLNRPVYVKQVGRETADRQHDEVELRNAFWWAKQRLGADAAVELLKRYRADGPGLVARGNHARVAELLRSQARLRGALTDHLTGQAKAKRGERF